MSQKSRQILRPSKPLSCILAACAVLAAAAPELPAAAPEPVRASAAEAGTLPAWEARIDRMLAARELGLRRRHADALVAGREHLRFAQLHRGVPVYGGELVQQRDAASRTVSIFSSLYEGVDVTPEPRLTPDQAVRAVEALAQGPIGAARQPELVILPKADGGYALTYKLRAASDEGIFLYFVSALDGSLVDRIDALQTAAAVGLGTGALGDTKKLSTDSARNGFVADDRLRPPSLRTYDMKGDPAKPLQLLFNGVVALDETELAWDADNTWEDGAVVDVHAYLGWTYDYYFKRFGRRGLDDKDMPITSIVHPVKREQFYNYIRSAPLLISYFFLNAFYAGDGMMLFGEGLPVPLLSRGRTQNVNYYGSGLDVVAHELTHGVTEFTSGLVYRGESGALNEAFSDIMGTSVEFFHQPPGPGIRQADYLCGEDVVTPGGSRSMQNPAAYGDPDHYSIRYTGPFDGGGVHANSSIANHAFYLAVEGGTHRLSGVAVQGVGAAAREQIEKAFYRAFTSMLPATAVFSTARAATIQAARDLYGAGSAAERALTQAWNAVGVS